MDTIKNEFQTQRYRQFTFEANDPILSEFLNEVAMNNINITDYLQNREMIGRNCVQVVVGTPTAQKERDINSTRRILKGLGIKFCEYDIIKVFGFPPVTPGIINTLYGALWCKVKVRSMVIGEETLIYIDVDDIDQALRILRQPTLRRCDP